MNAREYYYSVLAPHEHGQSFHHVKLALAGVTHAEWRAGLLSQGVSEDNIDAIAELQRTFSPHYSNDFSFDLAIRGLVRRSPTLKPLLEDVFVVKRTDFSFEACALAQEPDCNGHLVFFETGLWLVCSDYARLYVEQRDLRWTSRAQEDLDVALNRVLGLSYQLHAATAEWSRAHRYLQEYGLLLLALPEHLRVQYDSIHGWCTSFIIAHEIAHHALGHTSSDDTLTALLERIPPTCRPWESETNRYHRMEFQADALALLLCVGLEPPPDDEYPFWSEVMMVLFGSQLTFITLAELGGGVYDISSWSHPRLVDRLENTAKICKEWMQDERRHELFWDTLVDFRRWLTRVAERAPTIENAALAQIAEQRADLPFLHGKAVRVSDGPSAGR